MRSESITREGALLCVYTLRRVHIEATCCGLWGGGGKLVGFRLSGSRVGLSRWTRSQCIYGETFSACTRTPVAGGQWVDQWPYYTPCEDPRLANENSRKLLVFDQKLVFLSVF